YYRSVLLAGALVAFLVYLMLHPGPWWISLPFFLSVLVAYKHARAVWLAEQPAHIAPMMPVIVKCSLVTNILFAGVVIAQTLVS
ncbi:1,4-dihydroxy-2-naphthoate octaprenyltransferase, partial [Vibrio xuii]